MKKVKLKALELGAEELLQREQLKNVIGGTGGSNGGGSCTASVNCYRTIWQNGQAVEVANGSISCSSSSGNCLHGDTSVSCDNTNYYC
jgi:hypothetical protein